MGSRLTHITFEQWLSHVFDHPLSGSGPEWYFEPGADWWDGPPADTVAFMTRAFENAAALFQPYSDALLNQGLWYLASNACSNHMFALLDPAVPWPARQRCVRSMRSLFEGCFARRCTPHLGHRDEPGAGPLNSVCYMWWDLIPIAPRPGEPSQRALDREILAVMESTLQLDSLACHESALHGLGHWQHGYPTQVAAIISAFRQRTGGRRPELDLYAANAAQGCVL